MQKRSAGVWSRHFFSAGISLFCLQSNKIHGTELLEGFKKGFLFCVLFEWSCLQVQRMNMKQRKRGLCISVPAALVCESGSQRGVQAEGAGKDWPYLSPLRELRLLSLPEASGNAPNRTALPRRYCSRGRQVSGRTRESSPWVTNGFLCPLRETGSGQLFVSWKFAKHSVSWRVLSHLNLFLPRFSFLGSSRHLSKLYHSSPAGKEGRINRHGERDAQIYYPRHCKSLVRWSHLLPDTIWLKS